MYLQHAAKQMVSLLTADVKHLMKPVTHMWGWTVGLNRLEDIRYREKVRLGLYQWLSCQATTQLATTVIMLRGLVVCCICFLLIVINYSLTKQ